MMHMGVVSPKISYLRARDPSILTYGPVLDGIKCNLEEQFEEDSAGESTVVQRKNQIEVYLRVKNESLGDIYTLDNNCLVCNVPETSNAARHINKGDKVTRKFQFTQIFQPNSTQEEVFNNAVKARILNFINGKNGTIFTYGASGAGKTFTIVGTPDYPGIIPRSLEYLFKTLPKLNKLPRIKPSHSGLTYTNLTEEEARNEMYMLNELQKIKFNSKLQKKLHIKTYRSMQQRLSRDLVASLEGEELLSIGIWVSFAEIYNECIYDLLVNENKPQTKLKLCNNKGISYIKDLSSVYVSSGVDAYQLLQFGLENLKIAKTSINADSSRSHCIFTLTLVQADNNAGNVKISLFNFCDLAGSERIKKTHNKGVRLQESNNINNSLLVLGKCIHTIRDSQKANNNQLVPFRESKLTQFFQRALCGHEDIAMVVNVNPIPDMFDETLQALNFSAIAKEIIVDQPAKNEMTRRYSQVFHYNKLKNLIKDRDDEISKHLMIIEALETMIHEQMVKYEKQERDTRIALVTKFQKMMDEMDIEHDKKIELYRTKIENLESEISDLQARLESDDDSFSCVDDSVICLDDSNVKSEYENVNKTEQNLKQQLNKERLQKIALEEELNTFRSLLEEIKEEKLEVEEKLQEAAEINLQQDEQIKSLLSELMAARETISALEEREEAYRQNLIMTDSSNEDEDVIDGILVENMGM